MFESLQKQPRSELGALGWGEFGHYNKFSFHMRMLLDVGVDEDSYHSENQSG